MVSEAMQNSMEQWEGPKKRNELECGNYKAIYLVSTSK